MNRIYFLIITLSLALCSFAQSDRDFIRRGNRLMRDSLFDKAQVRYQKAIEADNANPQAHYNLGNALLFQSKGEEAMKEYEQAARMETNKIRKAKIYHNMGVVMQSAKQFDKAVAYYKNSLRNDPLNDETRYNLVLCKHQQQKQQQKQDQNKQNENQKNDDKKDQQKNEENKQKKQEQPKPQMSKENAEQLLNAAIQNEKQTQDKMKKAQQKPQRRAIQKNW